MLDAANKNVEAIMLETKGTDKAESPATALRLFMAAQPRGPHEVNAELRRLQLARGLDEPQKYKVLLEATIDLSVPKAVHTSFHKNATVLKACIPDKPAATMILVCLEDLVGVVDRKLLPFTAHILQTLYNDDVLSEESIITWFDLPPESSWLVNKEVAAEVRAKATAFVEWLKNADEESDDE